MKIKLPYGWDTGLVVEFSPRSPGLAVLGFLVTATLFGSVVVAGQRGLFGDHKWPYFSVLFGNFVLGLMIRAGFERSPWRSLGMGMLIAGAVGVLLLIVVVLWLAVVFSRAPI